MSAEERKRDLVFMHIPEHVGAAPSAGAQ
jgi:hypothetical protein